MVISGWILPNLVDNFNCQSFSDNKEHILVVHNYLNSLDESSRNKILKRAEKLSIKSLDDIAVLLLGWIKVSDCPYKTIYYIPCEDYDLLIQKYVNLGYIPIELEPVNFMG